MDKITELENRLEYYKKELERESNKKYMDGFSAWSCFALEDLIKETEYKLYDLKLKMR